MEEEQSAASDAPLGRRRMRPVHALAVSILIPCLLYVLLIALVGDNLFFFSPVAPGREKRAALSIRDNESPFYKWGTFLFTRHNLRRCYAESWHFTQAFEGDCEEAFSEALKYALETYPAVDLFLLAHTNKYIQWVESFPEELRGRIRFVYNTGCHNEPQGAEWLSLGAETYIGHPGVSLSPFFYFFLMRHWTHGASVDEILDLGNRRMERKFHQLEWVTRGRYNATDMMRESVAASVGDGDLRAEEFSP